MPLLFAISTTFALPSSTLNEMPVTRVNASAVDVQKALRGNERNTIVLLLKK